MSEVVSAEYVQTPVKRGGFPGRPWTVYYERAVRSNGKRSKCGMASFETKRDAIAFMCRVAPKINIKELPF